MLFTLSQIPALLLGGASIAGIVYQIIAAGLVRRFMTAPRPVPSARPSVSVMKPLCGAEAGLADSLASSSLQDYPAYQMVFGVADPGDPALSVVEALRRAHPDLPAAVVADARRHGRNLKVGNLINMAPAADGEILVIADSDVKADRHYLDDVVVPFADPKVGLVTCLYIGRPAGEADGKATAWSRLGALGVNHGFLPSALVARALGRKDGCFGATMALRRDFLDRLGGFARIQDMLADDWALGAMVRDAGAEIALAARPVEIAVSEPDFRTLLAHEVRWGRTIAAIDRKSYMASVTMQPIALAALCVAAALSAWPSWLILGLALAGRLWAIRMQETALGLPRAGLGLLAARELLSFVVFIIACSGRSVEWRGRRFTIRRDGTLEYKEGIPT